MKKLTLAMVLVLGGLTNACAVDAGDEVGDETADESAVIQEDAEALMSARDIGSSGARARRCAARGPRSAEEPEGKR